MFLALTLEIMKSLVYLALHVTGAGAFPPALKAKEEQELIKRYEDGDTDAKNKLIEHNLRLVAHVVKKYYTGQVEQDDLISIGTIGLIKAISTFKSSKGIRLATYAARCIENEILMYFRNLRKSANDVFISDPIDTDRDGNALTLIDVISDNDDIADNIAIKMQLTKLKSAIDNALDKREKTIIYHRYGIGGYEELTQAQIAQKLHISRSYVSRIEKAAILKLRSVME